jgi:hypothetical protein
MLQVYRALNRCIVDQDVIDRIPVHIRNEEQDTHPPLLVPPPKGAT